MDIFQSAIRTKDDKGIVCQLNHIDAPFRSQTALATGVNALALEGPPAVVSARAIADEYLREAMPYFGLNVAMLSVAEEGLSAVPASSNDQVVFDSEKSVMGNSRVAYSQMIQGIPVWESGIVVQVEEEPMQVVGSQSTVKPELQLSEAKADAKFAEGRVDADAIQKLLGIGKQSQVTSMPARRFVYQYFPGARLEIHREGPAGDEHSVVPFVLPPVADFVKEGAAYIVSAVEFTLNSKQTGQSRWLALIEQQSGSILLLRSLDGCVCEFKCEQQSPPMALQANDGDGGSAAAVIGPPAVVFFDIGDTLGKPVLNATGQLSRIDIFPNAFEVAKELFEKGKRVGVISDPGGFNTDLITSLLQDTGILAFMDSQLLVYGAKNSTAIFTSAATTAGVAAANCLFVGENNTERGFAAAAGFVVSAGPDQAVSLVDPNASLAWVYLRDPKTKVGLSGPGPNASSTELDRHRDLVSLVGLKRASPGTNQTLVGEYVRLIDIDEPSPTLPSSPAPGNFRFSVNTNDFGAVNAYHNCDRLYRLLEGFGINVKSYFDGTSFPVDVDHRVRFPSGGVLTANSVNAQAPGGALPPRSLGFQFALAALNTSVGMAADWRVVLHEFGHALLWDNVGSPNFRFSHSAGDAIAAILNDPGNRSVRGTTFPWVNIGRSHTRPVTTSAWYGTQFNPFGSSDQAGYVAEEILSSTMFRIYQAAGGDSTDQSKQEFAAAYVVFLIVKSIGLMTPSNNPLRPEGYADLLMQADTGTFTYRGTQTTIGALRKVVRWGFEMQGAFRQPPSPGQTRTNQVGNPPQVDIFINDGRNGQYQFAESHESHDVWNRQNSDNGTVNQDAVIGQTNFAYVRVSNRGFSQVTGVEARAFQCASQSDQVWPLDWEALSDPLISSSMSIAPGHSIVLGPFKWTPTSTQPSLLMSVSTTGDTSNLSRYTSANPIAMQRLLPFDNNIAQRTISTT